MTMSEAAALLGAERTGSDLEFRGCGSDSRTIERGALFAALCGPTYDGHDFVGHARQRGAAAALVSDRTAHSLPVLLVDDTTRALARLAAAWRRRFEPPVIAITGSNGKTTVKEMVAACLRTRHEVLATRGNLNNEIGLPLTLLELDVRHSAVVVEMGANHAGEIARLTEIARPTVGVITQCAPAHLEGFGSIDGVARAKGELFAGLEESATAIINADDPYASLWRTLTGDRARLTFALEHDADVSARWRAAGSGAEVTLSTPAGEIDVALALAGRHNGINAAAAAAAVLAMGLPLDAVREGLESLSPVKGRLQTLEGLHGCRVVDDSYNANPVSLRAALDVLATGAAPRWLVLGDMAELGPDTLDFHQQAGEAARTSGVDRLFTVGTLAQAAARSFGPGAVHFDDHEALVEVLVADAPGAGTVLVKGSRSMQMERVVIALTSEAPACS